MAIESSKVTFKGAEGETLAARLDSPAGSAKAYALFAHCFTCSKDIFAATRIARGLAERGIAVLRFDFTGLGASEGEFANTNFSSNVQDLLAAADFLRQEREAPSILVGHSLGGAAVLAAAGELPECRAVATIGAPADPAHVAHNFQPDLAEIETKGLAEVTLAGRRFTIKKQFLEDVKEQSLQEKVAHLKRALLVFHAPLDATVGIDNATKIFVAAKHPKSFVSLDKADHLLSRHEDAAYVAEVLAAWASRYLPAHEQAGAANTPKGVLVRTAAEGGAYTQEVYAEGHRLLADEPASVPGGKDLGPSPYGYLLAGLGACTSMTLRMYADRKDWPLEKVSVKLTHGRIHAEDCADCEREEGMIDEIRCELTIEGPLDADQRARLLEIADRCPVHRTLENEIKIRTKLTE
jgi:putative redox protein